MMYMCEGLEHELGCLEKRQVGGSQGSQVPCVWGNMEGVEGSKGWLKHSLEGRSEEFGFNSN
jgi:hypothetical protein